MAIIISLLLMKIVIAAQVLTQHQQDLKLPCLRLPMVIQLMELLQRQHMVDRHIIYQNQDHRIQ